MSGTGWGLPDRPHMCEQDDRNIVGDMSWRAACAKPAVAGWVEVHWISPSSLPDQIRWYCAEHLRRVGYEVRVVELETVS